jgi:hypothetical protein
MAWHARQLRTAGTAVSKLRLSHFLHIFSIFSIRRPGWQRLPLVSFAYPVLPLACLSIAGMVALYGVLLKPGPSLTAAASVIGGCLLCKRLLQPGRSSDAAGCDPTDGPSQMRA